MHQQRAYATGTNRNRACQIRAYMLFCLHADVQVLPVTDLNLCRYITFLARSFNSYQTLLNYIDGARYYHSLMGYSFDVKDSFIVKNTLRGVRRQLGDSVSDKLPITPRVLLDIYQVMDHTRTVHIVVWAAFLVAFYGFLRKSNVVPPSAKLFDNKQHLGRSSIVIHPDKLIVTLHKTKTIQFSQRKLDIPMVSVPGSPLCPVSAVSRMIQRVPAPDTAPAFLVPLHGQWLTLTHSSFVNYLRYFLTLAGYEANKYTGHSFRKGGCSFAATCQVPENLIKFHGDWHSSAYERYMHLPLDTRSHVTRLMAKSLSSKS